jgi:hypothetical protein
MKFGQDGQFPFLEYVFVTKGIGVVGVHIGKKVLPGLTPSYGVRLRLWWRIHGCMQRWRNMGMGKW